MGDSLDGYLNACVGGRIDDWMDKRMADGRNKKWSVKEEKSLVGGSEKM